MPTLNVNVGVLGHVDSGKTSLVAALSTTLSTAALDKNPQSRERGITLDLGFSSFTVAAPPHIEAAGYRQVQFTLVDCPGHASLIRTIMGGAQIIDLMVLVVDAARGIQAQTAECLVIGEVAVAAEGGLVVALNKTDQFPADKRERYCRKAQKLVVQTLQATRFAGCPIVPLAARPGAGGGGGVSGDEAGSSAAGEPQGLPQLLEALLQRVRVPGPAAGLSGKEAQDPFLFYIDHCFAIKGQGTVMTGTVMRGSARVGDTLELPELRVQKKVKSMQMFRQPVQECRRGDRLGICVTQLDAKLIERGLACAPGKPNSVPTFEAAVALVEKIRFHAGEVRSRTKMHVTVGHSTVMAELLFFGLPDGQEEHPTEAGVQQQLGQLCVQQPPPPQQQQQSGVRRRHPGFDSSREYVYQVCLYGAEGRPPVDDSLGAAAAGGATAAVAEQHPADQQQQQHGVGREAHHGPQWVYLRFAQPVTAAAPDDCLLIGSRLDADPGAATCRLAFHGRLCALADPADPQQLQRLLPVYKSKQREGTIERVEADGCTAVCRGMFQRETDLTLFTGMRVTAVPGGQEGRIEGGFGKTGKFRVRFPGGAPQLQSGSAAGAPAARVLLRFKRFLFDPDKRRMAQ